MVIENVGKNVPSLSCDLLMLKEKHDDLSEYRQDGSAFWLSLLVKLSELDLWESLFTL